MTVVPLQNTEAWVAWRRGGVGASDMPALLGEDPYRSEFELAMDKRGLLDAQPQNEAQAWGHRVQRMALEAYAESSGLRIRNIRTTLTSKRYPHVYASLDGRVVGERRGIEVKLTRAWEEPPRRVVIQCQVQMGVADLDAVDVVRVGMGYQAPVAYTIERDDLLIHDLMEMGEAWYLRYVLGDEMPPIDGSPGAQRYLDRIEGPPEMVADDEQAALVARYGAAQAAAKAADAELSDLKARIKDSMHGSYALLGHGFRISWSPSKARATTDWKGTAMELASYVSAQSFTEAVEGNTTTATEGTRPFRVTFRSEEEPR